jgi:ribosomal protein S18 acetylase RimI-like enzyme
MAVNITTRRVDYANASNRAALCSLLNHYAQDPMGGGAPLASDVLARLCDDLAQRAFAFSFIAWASGPDGELAVGLVNCMEGYSTFKAKPLINIHDLIVHSYWRGQGVGQRLMQAVEQEARSKGACKITLEVLTGNRTAMQSYERFGFAPYALDPKAGTATFMQKWL